MKPLFVILMIFSQSTVSLGQLRLLMESGASLGTLRGQSDLSFSGYCLSAGLYWKFKSYGVSLGVSSKQHKLQSSDGINKSSTLNLAGPGLFWEGGSSSYQLGVGVHSYISHDLTVLSHNLVLVNDKPYEYSAVENHVGPTPIGVNVSLMHTGINSRLSVDQEFVYGLKIESITYDINKVQISTASSHDRSRPSKVTSIKENQSWNVVTASIVLGLSF